MVSRYDCQNKLSIFAKTLTVMRQMSTLVCGRNRMMKNIIIPHFLAFANATGLPFPIL